MAIMKKPFNIPLKFARVAQGLSQRELADAVGRSPAYISRLEGGGPAHLDDETRGAIARTLGVPENFVFSTDDGLQR